ncbi:uncharacterized protein TRUGW13939_10366 [Talaromyces rugulosus]|uniref:Uncharacterized protein n=1 Tax=Talaromyces rugulosus TaxID=121627 RepID=A0A7H8RAR4_TALRU|nr:uncharacterized protein TRUGW13939_10366 [Talaromyces rugulosus]QKX63197.1 hypothetical protein TRUGW13939_10366 [Talaromyces rugulosus]
MFREQENTHGYLPEYLVRSIKANPEHEWAVHQYLEASERLIQVAGENADVHFYFFQQYIENPSNIQPTNHLQDTLLAEPHQEQQDILSVDPKMIQKRNIPLDEALPSESIEMSDYLDLDMFKDGFADETPVYPTNTTSGASFRLTEGSESEYPATSLPSSAGLINSPWENTKETTTLADAQQTVEDVANKDDNPPLQAHQNTSQTRDHAKVKENGLTPSGYPAKKIHTAEGLTKPRKRKLSIRSKKAEYRQSAHSMSGQRLLKPKSPGINNTDSVVTTQKHDCPYWMKINSSYAPMWFLFGPGHDKALTEDNFKDIFKLVTDITGHDQARFLEIQSNLWQTNRFWNPDPLCFPVTENLSIVRLCLSFFHYLQNLGEGTMIDAVRGRFARIRLHLSFNRLFNEEYQQRPADHKRSPNKREVASHVINDLVNVEQYQEDSLKEKDRQKFKTHKTHGKKWFLIAHYIGWGALIIWDNDNSKIGKMSYTMLKAFITYIVNARPDIVALCREYEGPVKALLAGKNPTHILRQEDVRETIRRVSQEAPSSSWKKVDVDTEVDESDFIYSG